MMSRRIQLKKTGNKIEERIDFLREVTAALLDEVKTLTPFKEITVETGIDLDQEVKKFEIYLIERALEKTGGSQIQAAQLLNLKHTTLHAKIKRYEICLRDLYSRSAFNGSK